MAIYAFDGTWNKNRPKDEKDTNVVKFFEAYAGEGKPFYVSGPGTRFGWFGKAFGGIFGAGGKARVKEALKALGENFRNGDRTIDIIGFSRGAALAIDFANCIHDEGVAGVKHPAIRFVGVWDCVASFGIPGNDINLGYTLRVPDSVGKCYHAMALDERRQLFPLNRLATPVERAEQEGRVFEVWFRGVHSDVGGGNGNVGLSAIALRWMHQRALAAGLSFSDDADKRIGTHTAKSNPEAKIGRNVDVIENPWRIVGWNDVVHRTVRPRQGCNNPPVGTAQVDEDSDARSGAFGGN